MPQSPLTAAAFYFYPHVLGKYQVVDIELAAYDLGLHPGGYQINGIESDHIGGFLF